MIRFGGAEINIDDEDRRRYSNFIDGYRESRFNFNWSRCAAIKEVSDL